MKNEILLAIFPLLLILNITPSTSGEFHYYIHDHLGNTRVVVDENGDVEETYDYYPFGMVLRRTLSEPIGTIDTFTGKELDEEGDLDWYYFGARFYDARIGRWNAVDPLASVYPQSSPFVYTLNNPVKFLDPDGEKVIAPDNLSSNFTPPKKWEEIGTELQDSITEAKESFNKGNVASAAGNIASGVINAISDILYKADPFGVTDIVGVGVADDAVKSAKFINKVDDLGDAVKGADSGVKATKKSTDFIVNSKGQAVAIPDGAFGPVAPDRGRGMVYKGGSGGKGMNKRTTGVRIMDANNNQGRRVNYMNKSGQTVDPKTGRTISNRDARGHLPYEE